MKFYNYLKHLHDDHCFFLENLEDLTLSKLPKDYKLSKESSVYKQSLIDRGLNNTFLSKYGNNFRLTKIHINQQAKREDKKLLLELLDINLDFPIINYDNSINWDRLDLYLASKEIFKDIEIISRECNDPLYNKDGDCLIEGEYKIVMHHKGYEEYVVVIGTISSYGKETYYPSFEECVKPAKPKVKEVVEYTLI